MFGIGMPEIILILIVSLIVVGPKKLPDFAKTIGNAVKEFKKATYNIKESTTIESKTNENKDGKNTNTNLKKTQKNNNN